MLHVKSPDSRPQSTDSLPQRPRITKPPVPRARRTKTISESTDASSAPQVSSGCSSPISTPATARTEPMMPAPLPTMYPYMLPVIIPITTLYGSFQVPKGSPGTAVVYTSGPIPPNTTSIVLVPMAAPSLPPSTPRINGSGSSEKSESVYGLSQPVVIFIERNVFKQWFEGNVPVAMRQLPYRIKRYKSTETFMHWLSDRKRHEQLELYILIRVTEVNKLLSAIKMTGLKSFRIFSYDHLIDISEQPGKSLRSISEDLASKLEAGSSKVNMFHSLQEACSSIIHPV